MAITISGDSPNFTSVAATTVNGVTTLNSSSGVLATQNGMTGIAKAWVNFNGTGTVAIRDSFNVSSITDNGTGDYTINFTTAMPNANYAINGTGSGTSGYAVALLNTNTTPTTSLVRISTVVQNAGSPQASDMAYVSVSVFSS